MHTKLKRVTTILLTACLSVAFLTSAGATQVNDTTHVTVDFKAGEGPTNPVNPEDPTEEVGGPDDGVLGEFIIISVSDFDFRTEEAFVITLADERYPIQTPLPNIQIVDLRGTGTPWKVRATLDEFTNGGFPSMKGSSISIADGHPNSANMNTTGPVSEKDIELVSGDSNPQLIMTAGESEAMGLWVMRWYPDVKDTNADPYIYLNVPGGSATRGENESTVTWLLENAD